MGPGDLQALVRGLPRPSRDDVLVGLETADDAGVVQVTSELAIVTTADFITPPFDDPALYGAIAAANALSDVFAMGGEPMCVINLCAFPRELPPEVGREILAAAHAKTREAGAAVVGGHTVAGPELFFGLAVTGRVHPDRVWKNRGLRRGDKLILTKPLGTGYVVGAARAGKIEEPSWRRVATIMASLNRNAARIAAQFAPSGVTDVTGFGLAGHAIGMVRDTHLALQIDLEAIPMHAEVPSLIEGGVTCRGEKENKKALSHQVEIASRISGDPRQAVIFDPQTSGGLLFGVAPERAEACLKALRSGGVEGAAMIGEVTEAEKGEGVRLFLG